MSATRRVSWVFTLFVALAVVGAVAAKWRFDAYERAFHLSFVPDVLGVTSMSYVSEESAGFGPGANESGIRVYPLPESALPNTRSGLLFFEHMPQHYNDPGRGWRGSYSNWRETPVVAEAHRWERRGSEPLKAIDYLCYYGICADVDPAVLKQVDDMINSPGSYYAYGRIGMLIVSPAKRLVVYLYNG